MSDNFIFNYNQFYDYYTNSTNLLVDKAPPVTLFYKPFSTTIHKCETLKEYIIVDNKKFYVTYDNGKLLFTFPVFIDNNYWDFHYHFGVNAKNFRDKKTKKIIPVVFFHKTIQVPKENTKYSDNCYFYDNSKITKIEDVLCVQTASSKMSTLFPIEGGDFKYIEDIIRRPFSVRTPTGGSTRNKIRKIRKTIKKRNQQPL